MWLTVPWRRDRVSLGSNTCVWERLMRKFEQKVWPLPLTLSWDFSSLHPRTVGDQGRERGGPGPQPFSLATGTGRDWEVTAQGSVRRGRSISVPSRRG